jgi:hypothetical protein
MPDFSKGKIYKLIDNTNGNIYIGSTTLPLNERLYGHTSDSRHNRNNMSSSDIIKNGDYHIELIEDYPCQCKAELDRREGYYIHTLNCVNQILPGRTYKERLEYDRQRHKTHYDNNTDKESERKKAFYYANQKRFKTPNICICGQNYTCHKSRHLNTKHHQKYIKERVKSILEDNLTQYDDLVNEVLAFIK